MEDENIFEDFLKTYYRKNLIPNEIVISKSLENKMELEKFLSKQKNQKVKIIDNPKKDNRKLLNLAIKNLDEETSFEMRKHIKESFNLPNSIEKIDCFDISNLSYKDLVGACIRFENEKKIPSKFRKYEIKTQLNKNDDYFSFREVIFRRYLKNSKINDLEIGRAMSKLSLKNLNLKNSKEIDLPDLIICDGGAGQLNSTLEVLKLLKLDEKVQVVSLAKKEEIILKYENNILKEFNFDNNSRLMIYIRKIRDATHNFVKGYNISKRKLK